MSGKWIRRALKSEYFSVEPLTIWPLLVAGVSCAHTPRADLQEISMTNTLTALVAAGTLATEAQPFATADARCAGCLLGAGELPPEAPPGYVYFPPMRNRCQVNCNWFRSRSMTFAETWSLAGRPVASAPGWPAIVLALPVTAHGGAGKG